MKHKRVLGKGLEALIPEDLRDELIEGKQYLRVVDIDRINPASDQPRKTFSDESIAELAASIAEEGILQPIIITPTDDGYKIVVGERRWRASQKAGLKKIPALIIEELTPERRIFLSIIENIQREDLNPLEEALAYKQLQDQFDIKQSDIAERVGKSRSTVTNMLRILKLPAKVKQMLQDNLLTMGHARALLSLDNEHAMLQLARLIINKDLSVRKTEILAQTFNTGKQGKRQPKVAKKEKVHRPPEMVALEQQFQDFLGTKVQIEPLKGGAGKIIIRYYDEEDLERISGLFYE